MLTLWLCGTHAKCEWTRRGKISSRMMRFGQLILMNFPRTIWCPAKFKRVLRLGTRPVGAIYIAGSSHESRLDPRSVDAIASLSAIALERAHSFAAESNAEAAKRSEQLRSTVLDGLAHAFKTTLATIQSE